MSSFIKNLLTGQKEDSIGTEGEVEQSSNDCKDERHDTDMTEENATPKEPCSEEKEESSASVFPGKQPLATESYESYEDTTVSAVSVHNLSSITTLLNKAMEGIEKNDENDKELTNGKSLWELALHIRTSADDAKEALENGVISKMVSVIAAKKIGGWDSLINRREIDRFICAVVFAQLAASVLHELCRYQNGCVELAKSDPELQCIAQLPLVQIQVWLYCCAVTESHESSVRRHFLRRFQPGMLEQALVDTFGRCISGLNDHEELRKNMKKLFHISPLLDGIQGGATSVSRFVERFTPAAPADTTTPSVGVDTRFLDVESYRRFGDLLEAEVAQPWRSTYYMERIEIQGDKAVCASQAYGDHQMTLFKLCYGCDKQGATLKCSACKTTTYCTIECQKGHWKQHKTTCRKKENKEEVP